jgi:uncharacterized protein
MTSAPDADMTGEQASGRRPFAAAVETHTGAVFFVGDRAFKLKKPVDFGFLDFTTPSARAAACRREVELNRRLSPDVYLGVAELRGPDGEPSEHLVVMRRLPAERSLRALAEQGAELDSEIKTLADRLAAFHSGAERSDEISRAGTPEVVAARWRANDERMRPLTGSVFDPETLTTLLAGAELYIAGRTRLFARRAAAGRICDGHGDLLTDDIFFLPDGPRILDCLEFDDALRYCDVLADLASLAMDLEHRGRPELAGALLERYRDVTGDDWPPSLAHHYVAYRAQVRALVAGLRFRQGDAGSADDAVRLLAQSRRHLDAGRVRLVVVGGLPGSGKSTLAAEVASRLGATVLRSDEIRKARAGLDPRSPTPASRAHDLYRPEVTEATYRHLLAEARSLLADGRSVVADATFAEARWRRATRQLAGEVFADLDEVRCVAPIALLEARVARRGAVGGDASDATVAVVRAFAASEAPWPEASLVETSGSPEVARARVLEVLGIEPAGPPSA